MILLLADENFPLASHFLLETYGVDIKHIVSEGLSSIKDHEVIGFAIREERVIVTFDSDFGELIFKLNYKPKGVIYFRWKDFKPKEPGEYLIRLIESEKVNFEGYLTVINRNKVRQRRIGK